jgi:hypothetical protein
MATLEAASPQPPSGHRATHRRLSPVQEAHGAAVLAKLALGEFTIEEVATGLCGPGKSHRSPD